MGNMKFFVFSALLLLILLSLSFSSNSVTSISGINPRSDTPAQAKSNCDASTCLGLSGASMKEICNAAVKGVPSALPGKSQKCIDLTTVVSLDCLALHCNQNTTAENFKDKVKSCVQEYTAELVKVCQ